MKWVQRKPVKKPRKNDTILEKLARVRGIENAREWLNPPWSVEHRAYLLDNIDEVAQRIIKAIHLNQKMVVMADIDADGVFACSVMMNYLKDLVEEDNLDYIHAQRSSGHGLETVIKDEDKEEDPKVKYLPEDTDLLIIVDSSSNSVEGCKKAVDMGMDVIVIDHHLIEEENPYATIVNCQQGAYPNKDLSGSAMAYKVCQVMDDYMGEDLSDDLVDLSAIGIISDMMSVKNLENRFLILQGLKNINNLGLHVLLKKSKVDLGEDISTTTISFKVSPVINACTRFDKIELAIELLTTDDPDEANKLAGQMIKMNDKRKEDESEIVKSALARVDNSRKIAVLYDNEIGSGFRGLVAMQLVSKLGKPVFVLKHNEENDMYNGSARSFGDINLKNLVEITGDFEYSQGHTKAFGIGIEKKNLNKALDALDKLLEEEDDEVTVEYDLEIDESDITDIDIKQIEQFGLISGQGFPEPVFLVKGLVADSRELLGKKKKETVKIACDNGMALMKFKVDENYAMDIEEALNDDEMFMVELDVVGTLNINNFFHWGLRRNIVTNQVFIKDYRLS